MNILTVTTLFPNSIEPKLGIFIRTRLEKLCQRYPDLNVTVIAPVPWFPFKSKRFGSYAKFASVPKKENIGIFTVYHPRYLVIPKIGMTLTPYFLSLSIKQQIMKLKNLGNTYEVVDGHYFYPDGVALGKALKNFDIPFTCTARGTDINLIPTYPRPKKAIQKVFAQASYLMAVCEALKSEMISLGADEEKVAVLRNGVDLTLFPYADEKQQYSLKDKKKVDGKLVLSVGWLIERKGHHLVIEAISKIPNVFLAIAGEGPEERTLKALSEQLGVQERLQFLGPLDQTQLSEWYRAADVTVLASSREGWANVLLESLASGTPVVATKVWGTPEVVSSNDVGILVERNATDIQNGIEKVLTSNVERKLVREYAERFDWNDTSDGQIDIFRKISKK